MADTRCHPYVLVLLFYVSGVSSLIIIDPVNLINRGAISRSNQSLLYLVDRVNPDTVIQLRIYCYTFSYTHIYNVRDIPGTGIKIDQST